MTTSVARILVVDDNPAMREAIAIVLEDEEDLALCGESHGIADALEKCEQLHPDLALIDISLKGEDGLDLVRRLAATAPSVLTVVFSLHDDAPNIDLAREAGARGFAVKSQGSEQMLARIRAVLAGESSFATPGAP